MKDINTFKETLNDLITDDLGQTIVQLKEHLPEGTEKYKQVIVQEGHFKSLNKQRLRSTINYEVYQLESNKIRSNLLDIIDNLSQEDFNPLGKTSTHSTYQKGTILYDISSKMKVGTTHKCVIRIAFDEDALLENIELGEDAKLQDIRISNVMLVDMVDPSQEGAFSVYTISEKEQFIDEDSFTQWVYYVKPLKVGQYPLVLKVAIVEVINNKERKREIVLEEMITIVSEEEKIPVGEKEEKAAAYTFVLAGEGNKAATTGSSGSSRSVFYKVMSVSMITLLFAAVGVWAIAPIVRHNNFWEKTISVNSKESYEEYLDRYPDGKYASIAKQRIDSTEPPKEEAPIEAQQDTINIPTEIEEKESEVEIIKTLPKDTPKENDKISRQEPKEEEKDETPIPKEEKIEKEKLPVPKEDIPAFVTDDRDGKKYKVVKVGTQLWMAENLDYKSRGTFQYNNTPCKTGDCGRLYRWDEAYYACPKGWRLPTDKDWRKFALVYGGCDEDAQDGGRKAFRALYKGGSSGFNAMAGGEKDPDGKYNDFDLIGNYWSITPYATSNAYYYYFDVKGKSLIRSQAYKKYAFACRCVKD